MITDLKRHAAEIAAHEIGKAESIYSHARTRLKEDRKAFRAAKADHEAAVEAQQVIQEIARRVQQQAHQKICGLVTRCLKAVYADEAYEFSVVFHKKRGKTEAKFVFTRGGEEFDEPIGEVGGGMIEVANFALRVAEIVMTGKRRLIVDDEPLRNVHGRENRERLVELLPALCRELDFQMIFATGLEWLHPAGKVVEIKK